MLKIYHNPRCRKSREGLQYLNDKKLEFEVVDYLKDLFSKDDLKKILMKLNKKPEEIIRTQEEYYRKELKGKKFTYEEWIEILAENPKLIQRPIVEGKYKAVIAQPPEKADEVLKTI
ncbi:MAG: hypothetical protein JXB00_05270 [Bacteroidales bacterium]|nr:hypothetical protein [Bacteroidales bacterium]